MTGESLAKEWRRQRFRRWAMIATGSSALIAILIVSLGAGATHVGVDHVLRALTAPIFGATSAGVPTTELEVVRDLRLPRALMAVIAGAGLSISGAAMQGLTRNVLVSPYTMGISPAAAFGASIAILMGSAGTPYLTVLTAFVMALICAATVLGLSAMRGVRPTVLVLAGVGLTYLFGALTATVQFVGTEQQLSAIVHWTFGSLNGVSWGDVAICGIILLITAPLMVSQALTLNAFAGGGDDLAASLGFAVAPIRLLVTSAAVLLTAAIVSSVGVIRFVGLVAPHIARMAIGTEHKALLPFSALVGAILVAAADLVGRLAFAPVVVPVGIVVAYIGVPIFLQLLLTQRHIVEE